MADCARAEKILTAFRSKVGDDAYNEVQLRDILDEFRMGCEKGDCISDCAGPVERHLLRGRPRLKAVWDRVLADVLLETLSSMLADVEYDAFLDIMMDMKRYRYVPGRARHVSSCAGRVAQLLHGHPRLVRDSSYFLPDEHRGEYLATVDELEAHEAALILRKLTLGSDEGDMPVGDMGARQSTSEHQPTVDCA